MNHQKYIKPFLLLTIFFTIINAVARQTTIDSLKELIVNTKTDTSKIILLEQLGQAYREEKMLDSSIMAYKQALALNEQSNYSLQKQCWNMGALNYLLYITGNYAESLEYASRGLVLSEKLKDTFQLGHVHLAFGHNYKALGEYRLSLEHYFKAKQIFKLFYESRKQPEDNTYTILCISDVYLKMNQPDSALIFVQQAYQLALADSSIGTLRRKNSLVTNYTLYAMRLFGDIYFTKGYDEKALNYYRQYVHAFIAYKENNRDLGFVFINMAKVFQKNALNDSAAFYAKKALEYAQEYEDQENLFNAALLLSGYYKGKDDHKAFDYLQIATSAKDSMISSDKLKQAQLLSFNERVREKQQAEADTRQAARTKLTVTIAAIIVFITGFLIWNRIRQLRLKHKMILEQKEVEKITARHEKEMLELEAKAMRAQMNPHFIFNCMNSIKSLMQQKDEDKAVTYLTTFSKLLRTILQNSDKREISLFDEIETCKLYTQLESMRFGKKFNYSFDIDETIDLKSILVPALIIQPFIENAIWHGIMPKESGGSLFVSISRKDDKVFCVIEDDGIGRGMSKKNKFNAEQTMHQSKGVHLTQTLIDLNNALNQGNATLKIIDKKDFNGNPSGTKVIQTFIEF